MLGVACTKRTSTGWLELLGVLHVSILHTTAGAAVIERYAHKEEHGADDGKPTPPLPLARTQGQDPTGTTCMFFDTLVPQTPHHRRGKLQLSTAMISGSNWLGFAACLGTAMKTVHAIQEGALLACTACHAVPHDGAEGTAYCL